MKIITLNQVAPWTDDFFYLRLGDSETLVICNPQDSVCHAPTYLRSRKTLAEHIRLVNECQLEKAMIVGEDIGFLRQCPTLRELDVQPSFDAQNFDFSPLYDLRSLTCHTVYGPAEDRVASVDYSRFPALEKLTVSGSAGHENIHLAKGLRHLILEDRQPASRDLTGEFDGKFLETLEINSSGIRCLRGLETAGRLRSLKLVNNRKLEDISVLSEISSTLTDLEIDGCGKIKDFSVLSSLSNLQSLRLIGSNKLPDLSFVRNMPDLKVFVFRMNALNGDLAPCLPIPYVSIQNRKHYNHKDSDFSKQFPRGEQPAM